MQKYTPPGMMNMVKPVKIPGSTKPGQFSEYKLRVPKNLVKKYNVIKIKAPRPIKFGEIKEANMVRKTKKQIYVEEEGPVLPTHGAGSVYNYERKEEARKKRRGYIEKKINADDLPYALRIGGKGGKRYTGKKEPILVNSSYFILTQCPDGVFEAVPVQAWYNFLPDIDYATLTSDEVEHEFSKRDRTLSYFTKKYQIGGVGDQPQEDAFKVKPSNENSGLKIHDIEDMDSDEDDDLDAGSGDEKPSKKKNQKKEKDLFRGKKKKSQEDKADSDEEETLDNFESKEVDYMSESSSEDELLEMDDEPDPEKENVGKAKDDLDLFSDSENEEDEQELNDAGKELKAILKKENGEESSEDEVVDDEASEEDEDIDNEFSSSAVFMQGKDLKKKKGRSGSSSSSKPGSRSNTPIQAEQALETISQAASSLKEVKAGSKRGHETSSPTPQSKKQKLAALNSGMGRESPKTMTDNFRSNSPALRPDTPSSSQDSSGNAITEEAIRRYLTHKPMTTTDLMRKFKTKKTGLSKEQTVNAIAAILKKIQLHQEKVDAQAVVIEKPLKLSEDL